MPVDHELVQRAAGALERLAARSAPVTMSLASIESNAPPIDVARRRRRSRRARRGRTAARSAATVPGAGRKPRPASSPLIRNSNECPRGARVVVAELLAVGDAELLAHQVDAGDLLGDRVLDLQPGVDLEEGDGAVLADQELAGAGADVAGLAQDRLGRRRTAASCCSSERNGAGASSTSFWWRRCSEQSRVETTTTLPCGVGQALGLDVARLVEVLLDEALAAAERRDGLARRRLEQLGDLLDRAGDLEAAAAAAVRRLDGDRQAVLVGEREDLVGAADRVGGAGDQRGAGLLGDVPGLDLVAEGVDRLGRRADPDQAGVDDGLGEGGVLGEEAVAGVHGVGAGLRGRRRAACRCTR